MPRTRVLFSCEEDGSAPFLDWFDSLPTKAQDKCLVRVERLREMGHELRRPEADLLGDGIYELRVGLAGVNYRILCFFHGNQTVVLSHGLIKEREIPASEIERAIRRRTRFVANPRRHTYRER